jgi:hypothetical protein
VNGGVIEDLGRIGAFIAAPLHITNSGFADLNSGTQRSVVMDNGGSLVTRSIIIQPQYFADIGGAATRFAIQGPSLVALSGGGPITIHSGAAGSLTGGRMHVNNVTRVSDASLTLVNSSLGVGSNSVDGTLFVEGPGARFTHLGTGSINVSVFDGFPTPDTGNGDIVVDHGAIFTAGGTVTIGGRGRLEIRNGGRFVVQQFLHTRHDVGPGPMLVIGGGSGAWNGQLDLNSVGAFLRTPTAAERDLRIDQLRSGRNGGVWDGFGIVSSAAAANPGYALGYRVDGLDLHIIYTRYGDADLDRFVNLNDFDALAANFGQSGRVWAHGDFNYDRVVNLEDFNLLAANFGLIAAGPEVTPDDWAALAAAVPEPVGSLAALYSAMLLLRRRRY